MSWMQFSELPASPEDTKFLIFGHFFFFCETMVSSIELFIVILVQVM